MNRKNLFSRIGKMGPAGIFCIAVCVMSGFGQSNKVTVKVDEAETVVAKEIFGVLMERLGKQWIGGIWVGTNSSIPNIDGMREDVIEAFKECGVGAAEWPGGCAAHNYDWSNNKNPANDVGTDRFMRFCLEVGCEPVIVGPGVAYRASSNQAWVRYINDNPDHPEWHLKYFKVGNEVWGCGGNQKVDGYIVNYNANYDLLKEPMNGKKLFIVAANDMEGRWAWLPTMLNSIGTKMDGIEYHDYIYYPNRISSTDPTINDYWTVISAINNTDFRSNLDNHVIPDLNKYDPDKRIKIILDEWGDWFRDLGDEWQQQNTVLDAVSAGLHLNIFIQRSDRILMAGLAQGVNVIHSLVNTHPTTKEMVKTPTFYVFKMFKPHHENNAKFIPLTTDFQNVSGGGKTVPAISAAATVDDRGVVNVSLTNVDLSASRDVTIDLVSRRASYTIKSAEVVTGPQINTANDYGKPAAVDIKPLSESDYSLNGKTVRIKMPSKSVVMIRLAAQTMEPE
jgi:alpha-N-arabinofuranosidase